jgi:hypothetical protein
MHVCPDTSRLVLLLIPEIYPGGYAECGKGQKNNHYQSEIHRSDGEKEKDNGQCKTKRRYYPAHQPDRGNKAHKQNFIPMVNIILIPSVEDPYYDNFLIEFSYRITINLGKIRYLHSLNIFPGPAKIFQNFFVLKKIQRIRPIRVAWFNIKSEYISSSISFFNSRQIRGLNDYSGYSGQ